MYYNKQVTGYIQKTKLPVKDLLIALRMAIHGTLPDIKEQLVNNHPVFICQHKVCFFKAIGKAARLGFYNSQHLDDLNGMLKNGKGNCKFIDFFSLREINDFLVSKWLLEVSNGNKSLEISRT